MELNELLGELLENENVTIIIKGTPIINIYVGDEE